MRSAFGWEMKSSWWRRAGKASLLTEEEAHREVDEMVAQFKVVYSTENTLRTALRGAALYKMSWFDALIWAYADEHGLDPLWSEDFQDGRYYGRVKVQNPFRMAVHEPAAGVRPPRV